ncbi:GFA family protein [Pseudomonas aeruginosa]
MLSGSCLCGAVRYEIDAPIESASHCHCSQCRKAHGAAFATYGKVRREAFRYVAGADAVAEYHSSPGVTRTFAATADRTCSGSAATRTRRTPRSPSAPSTRRCRR